MSLDNYFNIYNILCLGMNNSFGLIHPLSSKSYKQYYIIIKLSPVGTSDLCIKRLIRMKLNFIVIYGAPNLIVSQSLSGRLHPALAFEHII